MRSGSCWRPYHTRHAAGRSACLSTEGLRGILRTGYHIWQSMAYFVLMCRSATTYARGHHHTRQFVTPDRKVPNRLQICACASATEEVGARQVVASQLTTGRYLTYVSCVLISQKNGMVTPDQKLTLNIDCCSAAYRLVFLYF